MTLVDEIPRRHQGVQVAQAQKIQLDRTQFLDLIHVELGGDNAVLHTGRHRTHQGLVAHHDAGRMNTGLTDDARHLVDLLKELRVLLGPDRQCPTLGLDHFVPRCVVVGLNALHAFDDLRHSDDVTHRNLHSATQILEDRLGLAAGQGTDGTDMVVAVPGGEVVAQAGTQALREVAVDVGEALATGRQEPAEQQAVVDRVDSRNAQEVGHQRATGRTTPRPDEHRDALTAGDVVTPPAGASGVDVVAHHQEVAGELLVHDQPKLFFQPVVVDLCVVTDLPGEALLTQFDQHPHIVGIRLRQPGHGQRRRDLRCAGCGNGGGILDGFIDYVGSHTVALHPAIDLIPAHQMVGLLPVVLLRLVGVLAGVEVPHQLLVLPVLGSGMVGIVDHHQRDTQFGGEAHLGTVNLAHQIVEAALLVGVCLHELPGVQLHVELVAVDIQQRAQLLAGTDIVTGFDIPGELGY